MRHVEPQDLDVLARKLAELADALEIGAVADAGQQRVAVDPDEIAALDLAVASDFASAAPFTADSLRRCGLPIRGFTRPRGVTISASWV